MLWAGLPVTNIHLKNETGGWFGQLKKKLDYIFLEGKKAQVIDGLFSIVEGYQHRYCFRRLRHYLNLYISTFIS